MNYSKIFSMIAHRFLLLVAYLLIGIGSAQAGALEECRQQETTSDGYDACILASQQRSQNTLRALGKSIAASLRAEKDGGAFRAYALGESQFIRLREARCEDAVKKFATNSVERVRARLICETEMNFAHAEDLKQRYH